MALTPGKGKISPYTDLHVKPYAERHVKVYADRDCAHPDRPLGHGSIGGTPEAMRRLAALATQAAIQAEEEACWHAHQAATAEEWVA
jgi:hypothetical protein